MRRFLGVWTLVALASSVSACVRPGAGVGFMIGMAIAEQIARPEHEQPVEEEEVPPGDFAYVSPDGVPRPRSYGADERAHGLDAPAALASLHEADVASCALVGAPRGFGHARVTFAPSGGVSLVVVDGPGGLSPEAVACIGDRLGRATAPAFEGGQVTVGTSWFIP